MHKQLIVLAIIILISTSLKAQLDTLEARNISDKMKVQLNLSVDQYNKILPINITFFSKMKKLWDQGASKYTMYITMKSADAERDKTIKTILSDVQYQKFQKNKKANREAFKERYKHLL